jgi:general secretion pathway protein E
VLNIRELDDSGISLEPFREELPSDLLLKYGIFCIKKDNEKYIIISQEKAIQNLSVLSHYEINEEIAYLQDYEEHYNNALDAKKGSEDDDEIEHNEDEDDEENILDILKNSEDLLRTEESAPVIAFVNRMFYQAIKKEASDIHIEPGKETSRVRFRVNGVLIKYVSIPQKAISSIINRIKVISNLDISEKRIPQDGRTQVTIAGKKLDIRVSSLPSHFGERIVMRILMQTETIPTVSQLGHNDDITNELTKMVKNPHGIVLVTGPTGSGKSTTLYSLLQMKKDGETNIMTIEDPVEYNLEGISQTQVNVKAGLTFASGLRSILRQDPDVILIGEMRDKETAQIAIQSSLTGHLVLSTLHTNDSASSITRLVDIGIEEFLISSSLLGVLAQRLVRVLCDECKEEVASTPYEETLIGLPTGSKLYEPKGCKKCNMSGFTGRAAIGELMVIDNTIKKMIQEGANDFEIKKYCIEQRGMKTLKHRAIDMLIDGKTSFNEIVHLIMENNS